MAGHGAGGRPGVAGQQRLDDGQVLAAFLGEAVAVVAGLVALPGDVAEGAEEGLEPAQLLAQKGVAAGVGNEVVQPAVHGAGLGDESGGLPPADGLESLEVHCQGVQLGQLDPPAGGAGGLALEDPADLADLADLVRRDAADDGPAVGQQVDDADAGQRDERLADRRVADAEALGQLLGDEVLAGAKAPLEDIGEQGFHDRLAAQAVVAIQGFRITRGRHGKLRRRGGQAGRTSLWHRARTKASRFYRIRKILYRTTHPSGVPPRTRPRVRPGLPIARHPWRILTLDSACGWCAGYARDPC